MNSVPNSAVKLFPAWKELYEQAKTWEYGSFHPHEEIAVILQHRGRLGIKYYGAVRRAGRELENANLKCLANVPGKGYRIIHPREHIKEGSRRVKQSHRRMKSAFVVTKNTDVSQLSDVERRQHSDTLSHIGSAMALTANAQRSIRRLAAGLPLINRDLPKLPPSKDKVGEI